MNFYNGGRDGVVGEGDLSDMVASCIVSSFRVCSDLECVLDNR